MNELVEFIRARLDEDRAWADNPECAEDPARVLREVEAKRRIVEKLAYWDQMADEAGVAALSNFARGERIGWHTACRLLASVYADHDDYRKEWAL